MGNARDSYIIQYSTKHLSSTVIVKFFYELKGRGNNLGIITDTNSQFLTKSLVEVPKNALVLWKYFFKKWGCDYKLIKTVAKSKATGKIFLFNSSKLTGSKKVRFFYELKGRGSAKGIISETKATYLARSAVMISTKNYFDFVKFLRKWKCNFEIKEVLING